MDQFDNRVTVHAGAEVRKVQPFGCPKNGTMGQCYVERVDNGEFIGLVSLHSLERISSKKA
jgi:hypothetical protein